MINDDLRTRTVSLAEITPDDRSRWGALSARALEPNPFLDPAFLHTAYTWMPKVRELRLVVVEDDTTMLGLLPLSTQPRTREFPLARATTAGPFLRSFAPHLAPLVDPDRAAAVVDSLLTHLGSRSSGTAGLVELTLFPGSGPLAAHLDDVAHHRGIPVLERYRMERAVAHVGGDRPAWRGRLSSGRRKNLARYARRLEREVGALEGEQVGGDTAAFQELVDLEAAGWKGQPGGYALARSERKLGWYRELADELRRQGRLHVFRLRAGGRTVYMALAFRVGDHLFSTIDAYDETLAQLRPGNVGRAAELDHLESQGEPVTLDPCMHPKYAESSAIFPDRDPLVGLLLAPRGLHTRAMLHAAPSLRAARSRLQRPWTGVPTVGARP